VLSYSQLGGYEDAIRLLVEVLHREPENADFWAGLGDCYAGAEQFEDAVRAYDTAIRFRPNDATFYISRANARLQGNGNPSEMISDCTHALKWDRDSVVAYMIRREAHLLLGDEERLRLTIKQRTLSTQSA